MGVLCNQFDLLFTHVPKTGGRFVERLLTQHLGGSKVPGGRHLTYRRMQLDRAPTVRVLVVREPLDWYRSYWAYARGVTTNQWAWPIWEGGKASHPSRELDIRCGHRKFEGFILNVLNEFPNGFVRGMYCDFLNGTTHALRMNHLRDDTETLLRLVGFDDPTLVQRLSPVNVSKSAWKDRATLSAKLADRVREVDTLNGLLIPYIHEPRTSSSTTKQEVIARNGHVMGPGRRFVRYVAREVAPPPVTRWVLSVNRRRRGA